MKRVWIFLLLLGIAGVTWIVWGILEQVGAMVVSINIVAAGLIIAAAAIIRFTIVDEGTARAVMVFGKFSKVIFQWERHWMDNNWNIWKEGEGGSKNEQEKRVFGRIFGGLYIYFWPIQKIHHYKHRWSDIRLRENGKMDVEFHEEKDFNHVLLKPAVYAFKLFSVETKPPERIPVDVLVLITLRVQNPYLFLFVAPPTPIEDVLARISAEMRPIITSCFIDDLLQLRGESLWTEKEEEKLQEEPLLKGAKVINETLQKWGLNLADKGIEIRDIDLPPEYQKVAAAKKAQELKAIGRAEEIMGTVISAVARAGGEKEEEVQAEFKRNPEAFYQKHQQIADNTMTKLSMEERAYLRIETPGAEGALGDLLRLLGAGKRMPTAGGKEKEEKPEKKRKMKKPLFDDDLGRTMREFEEEEEEAEE